MSSSQPIPIGATIRRALQRGADSLDPDARASVGAFLRQQQQGNGGFRGRSAASDLYYTVFGLECSRALGLQLPSEALKDFVEARAREPLDFVHLTCLARCGEILWPASERPDWVAPLKKQIHQHACARGGFHRKPGQPHGAVYESFLAALALESLREPFPEPDRFRETLASLGQSGGGFINGDGLKASSTPVTAAALLLLRELKRPPPPQSIEWLLNRQGRRGGFAAAALVPLCDLLSTATALHALNSLGALNCVNVEASFEFVTGCWAESGGFYAHALDRTPDCEYTFYALLALGNLVESST